MPGRVLAIPDDLSNGPLDDGRARAEWFRAMRSGYDENMPVPDDVFNSWDALAHEVRNDPAVRVVVWTSGAVSDRVFLRMACERLASARCVDVVDLTPLTGAWGVGAHDEKELRDAFALCRSLGGAARQALAADFARLRDSGGVLRSERDGGIVDLPVDAFDGMVFSFTSTEWKRAVSVVGDCLVNCKRFDCIGDTFFSWRVRQLMAAGRLEAEGDQSHLRGYSVRRPS